MQPRTGPRHVRIIRQGLIRDVPQGRMHRSAHQGAAMPDEPCRAPKNTLARHLHPFFRAQCGCQAFELTLHLQILERAQRRHLQAKKAVEEKLTVLHQCYQFT